MNLIKDIWIPIRQKNGEVKRIAPWQITEGKGENEIIALATPRPDFDGALIQFLIGLLQTTCAPENPSQWRRYLLQPLTPEQLQAAFEPIAYAFELDGDKARFMQDLNLERETQQKTPIYELLIEAPRENTCELNRDHFIKRGKIEQVCLPCAAMALFTLQTNGPAGGQGHRTGLRGGGPITTLVLGNTLWTTCWLNILEKDEFTNLANHEKDKDSDRFPWLAPTRTSEKGKETTAEDVHPDQLFWSMPKRIRLLVSKEERKATCDLCEITTEYIVSHYITKNFGVNYKGPWKHPLSPYSIKDGIPSAIHPRPGGIGYRHWLGLVQEDNKREPALVIEHFVQNRPNDEDFRLWAFGYDMDNTKPRCWYDSTMPLILAKDTVRETYEFRIAALVNSAQQVSRKTRMQIKKALFKRPGDVKGDFLFIDARFWQETEGDFFESLYRLRDILENNSDVVPILEQWHSRLVKVSNTIFDDICQTWAFDVVDPKRIALAWRELQRNIYSKKLREQLGLPEKNTEGSPIR